MRVRCIRLGIAAPFGAMLFAAADCNAAHPRSDTARPMRNPRWSPLLRRGAHARRTSPLLKVDFMVNQRRGRLTRSLAPRCSPFDFPQSVLVTG